MPEGRKPNEGLHALWVTDAVASLMAHIRLKGKDFHQDFLY